MKWFAATWIALLVASCDDTKARDVVAVPPGTPATCTALLEAWEWLIAHEPDAARVAELREARRKVVLSWVDLDVFERAREERSCAYLLGRMDDDTRAEGQDLGVDPAVMRRMAELAAARTVVPPTGDAAVDDLLQRTASVRDQACACQDRFCAEELERAVDAIHLGALDAASLETREGVSKMIYERTSCLSELR